MKTLLFASCFLVAACGGAIDNPFDAGTDGGPANDGSPGKDGSPASDGGLGPPSCDQLGAKLAAEEPPAEACCATCDSLQCTVQVEGLCCPLTVNPNSAGVTAYENTLVEFHAAGCVANCPAIACATKATDNCIANGPNGTNGTCAQF